MKIEKQIAIAGKEYSETDEIILQIHDTLLTKEAERAFIKGAYFVLNKLKPELIQYIENTADSKKHELELKKQLGL